MFELRDNDKVVPLIKVSDTEYRVANANEQGSVTTFKTVSSGNIVITGVDSDEGTANGQHKYTLVETEAPAGYNKLDAPVAVTVGTQNSFVAEVGNNAGTVLPSTGGIGTTIFYTIGAVLVLGAGVLMVTKRRMAN